jgi:GTPase SAR1 family protein
MFSRERTKSFFAENEKEFEEIIKNNDENFSPRRKKKHHIKNNFEEEEFENLLFKSNYVMEKETPSLEEQIKNEEKELFNFLKKLNKNSNNSDNESEITDDSCETNSLNFTEEEINNIIIPKNVKNYSKTIKFMVIGKSGVGKTFFINKFINHHFDEKKYSKTENFEIKKIVVDFNENNNIQFEFWDTSEKFINSSLISIYYKIANAFLFIIDENTSNDFINNQINQIKNFVQNPKIFFIINNKNNNNNNNNFIINKNLLKNKNIINLNFYNIKNLFKFSDFCLFLESFFENKSFNKNCNLKRKINFQKNFYDEDKFLIKINN